MKTKKLIAILLCTCLLANYFPLFLLANYQMHAHNLRIENVPRDPGYEATIHFNYETSTLVDGSTTTPGSHNANYDILMRNASAGSSVTEVVSGATKILNSSATIQTIAENINLNDFNLVEGSLYSFLIDVYHMHSYATGQSPRRAPYDPKRAQEEVLYMTDLQVDGTGRGDKLTVTWDHPTYYGTNIFTGYRIYYAEGGDKVSDGALKQGSYKVVFVPEATQSNDTSRPNVRRLSYTITDSSLKPGAVYAVGVEPFISLSTEHNKITVRDELRYTATNKVSVGTNNNLNITYSTRAYRTDDVKVTFPLDVYEDGQDHLLLVWQHLSQQLYNVQRLEVWAGSTLVPDDSNWSKLVTFYSPEASYLNNYQVERPKDGQTMFFQIRVYLAGVDGYIESEIALYDPEEVTITPNKPDLEATDKITAIWSAFVRPPYNDYEESQVQDGIFIDRDVYYDVWITDEQTNLDLSAIPKLLEDATPAQLTQVFMSDGATPGYSYDFTQYAYRDAANGGGFVLKEIVNNKMYYIKVVAKKHINNTIWQDIRELESDPAIISYYVTADGEIARPQTVSKPPLAIKIDPDTNQEMIDQNSMMLEWKTSWYEVYDQANDQWHSKVALINNALVFGDDIPDGADLVQFYQLGSVNAVTGAFPSGMVTEDMVRLVDMGNAKYQLKVFPFEDLSNITMDFNEYLDSMADDWSTNSGWYALESPAPTEDPNKAGYLNYLLEDGSQFSIEPNTGYVILFRGYRELADGTKLGYPTFLIATTMPDETDLTIDPTVPVLHEDSHTSTSFTVWWINQPPLGYELSYSEIFLDDPDQGTIVPRDDVAENGVISPREDNGATVSARHYTVSGLFPTTEYYVWLRSVGDNDVSRWSNPVFIKLDDIDGPKPPDGLGLIGTENLKKINTQFDLDYLRKDADYLFIEWLRDANDTYVPQSATQGSSGDAEYFELPEMPEALNAKFNNLTPNVDYYIRAKTIMTVTMEDGELVFTYNYQVQLSRTYEFIDVLEIILPDLSEAPTSGKFLRKESAWSKSFVMRTGTSDDEYDGEMDPDLVPLPEQDFEITYDRSTDTVTFRFRSDKKDADGNKDNNVDQRFITSLVAKRTYTYGVDLTKYDNNNVPNRVVEIPYNVMSAFEERKISLKIKADNLTLVLPPGSLNTAEVKALGDYGRGSQVRIQISEYANGIPTLTTGEDYASKPQKIAVQIVTPSNVVNLNNLAEEAKVEMKLSNRFTAYDKNVGIYHADSNTAGWQRSDGSYGSESGSYTVATRKLANYAVIAKDLPYASTLDINEINALSTVSTYLDIADLNVYNPNDIIHASQFNNLVAAVASGSKTVYIYREMSDTDYNNLGKAGILVSGTNVSREAGIAALVRLYELKTKSSVKDFGTINDAYYGDIRNADAQYQNAMLKAEVIGFLDNGNMANPKGMMTFSDVFYMLDIIIQDAGL